MGPFMSRPTTTTTMPPSFPWFNLSNAVYEVPHRTTAPPTPVPIFLTSRSTEEPSPSTPTPTPPPQQQPELVIATEKIPFEVNIMATSQEHGDEEQHENVPDVLQSTETSNISPVTEEVSSTVAGSSPVVADAENAVIPPLEQSIVTPEASREPITVELIHSTPSLPSLPSTTIFSAPVIAISIIPSSVEHILVTQEPLLLPEIVNQVVEDNVAPAVEEIITPIENTEHKEVVDITTQEPSIPPTSLPPVVVGSEESTHSSISSDEVAPTEILEPVVETVVIPETPTSAPIVVSDEVVEVTTTGPVQVVSSHQSQETETVVPVISAEEPTTTSPIIEDETSSIKVYPEIPSSVMTPPDRESVVPEVEIITVTPPQLDVSVPSVEMQPPSSESAIPLENNDDQTVDFTTTSSIADSEDELKDHNILQDTAITIFAAPQEDAAHHEASLDEVLPTQEVPVQDETHDETETFSGTIITTTPAQVQQQELEVEPNFDTAQNAEPEVVTEYQEFITWTGAPEIEQPKPEVVAPPAIVPSPSKEVDHPIIDLIDAVHDDAVSETVTVTPSQTHTEFVTTTAPLADEQQFMIDDAIQINNDEVPQPNPENTNAQVALSTEVEKQPESVPHANPLANEVNSVNVDTFEIIPPQLENDVENVPEIQNQIMEISNKAPSDELGSSSSSSSNNEVDSQSDRNSDDDTIEIFAAQNTNVNQDESHVVSDAVDATTVKPVKLEQPEPEVQLQDDAITIMGESHPVGPNEDHHEIEDEEIMHPDDQHGSSDDSASTTQSYSHDETGNDDELVQKAVEYTTVASIQGNSDVQNPQHDDQVNDDVSQISDATTVTSLDDDAQNDIPATTLNPIVEKAQVLASSEEIHAPESKFRLDLSAFDHSEESGSHEIQIQSTSSPTEPEVVFDESQQLQTTHSPQVAEVDKQRDESEDDAVTSGSLSRDDIDAPVTTTQKYQTGVTDDITPSQNNDDVEGINNFEFDEVAATTINPVARSESLAESEAATTIVPSQDKQLRSDEIAPTTTSSVGEIAANNDFVEVSTISPSGFAAEYREELIRDDGETTPISSAAFKSETIPNDEPATTVETPVFDDDVKSDDGVDIVTTISPPPSNKAKSEPVDDSPTTVGSQINNDDESLNDDVTTTAPILTNDTTSTTPKVTRVISIDTMLIPERGVSIPSVSDDIVRVKSDLGRSDLQEENDSWLVQTAFKNRQIHGLFPSSRSQKRLFRSRSPRDTFHAGNGSRQPSPLKTIFKKNKKVTSGDPPKKLYFPSRSFIF